MGKLYYHRVEEKPNKATKHSLDLSLARDHVKLAEDICGFTVLSYSGAATFTLTLIFKDNSTIDLTQADLAAKDEVKFQIKELQVTNSAQPGLSLVLLLGYKI